MIKIFDFHQKFLLQLYLHPSQTKYDFNLENVSKFLFKCRKDNKDVMLLFIVAQYQYSADEISCIRWNFRGIAIIIAMFNNNISYIFRFN